MHLPIIIAIVGGSGSGKSWLTRRLRRGLGNTTNTLSLDDFYRDLSRLPVRERAQRNFDDPASIEWPLFLRTLKQIKAGVGGTIDIPRYDFKTHTRLPRPRLLTPCEIVLVDGLWLLHFKQVRQLFDLKIYIDCAETLRFERRLTRDLKHRSRSRASVLRQLRQHVAPMHNRYVAPQRRYADKVFGSGITRKDVLGLIGTISSLIDKRSFRSQTDAIQPRKLELMELTQ